MQFARTLYRQSDRDLAPAPRAESAEQARAIAIGSQEILPPASPEHGFGTATAQAPSVTVNNNGQYYRPWREELGISFGRSVGNFFAFPVRLVGGIFEGILGIGMTIVKLIVMAIVMPTLIYTGFQMYEAKQNGESSTEVAAEVASDAVGLFGAALGGIWDGIFGGDDA